MCAKGFSSVKRWHHQAKYCESGNHRTRNKVHVAPACPACRFWLAVDLCQLFWLSRWEATNEHGGCSNIDSSDAVLSFGIHQVARRAPLAEIRASHRRYPRRQIRKIKKRVESRPIHPKSPILEKRYTQQRGQPDPQEIEIFAENDTALVFLFRCPTHEDMNVSSQLNIDFVRNSLDNVPGCFEMETPKNHSAKFLGMTSLSQPLLVNTPSSSPIRWRYQ